MLRSVFAKVVHDQWRLVVGWGLFAAIWPAMYVGLYPSIEAMGDIQTMIDKLPPAIREFFASSELNIGTAEGFLNLEFFTFIAPLLVLAYTVVVAGGATAGEEERGTMDLLLANPIPRWRVVVEKAAAFVVGTIVIVAIMWVGAAGAATAVGIDLDLWRLAQALVSVLLLGLALGGLALALGAMTGRRWLSAGVSLMVVIAGFFLNGLGALIDWLEPWRPISPFYHYIANDPLVNGLEPVNVLVLLGWAVVGGIVAVIAFERRDLAR
jgi:ABC-2 type transport system permease protein